MVEKSDFKQLSRGYKSISGWGNTQISYLEVAKNFLLVFNMSATMARQGDWVQLEQSNMCLALTIANMAKRGVSCTAIEELQYLIRTPGTEVQEEKKLGFGFPGHTNVKATIERHPAMGSENPIHGCLHCQNAIVQIVQICWMYKGTGAFTKTDTVSGRNATCHTCVILGQWRCSKIHNRSCAIWICVYTQSTSQHSLLQFWCICQESQRW